MPCHAAGKTVHREYEGERRLEKTYKSCMKRIVHISKDQVGYRGLPSSYRSF